MPPPAEGIASRLFVGPALRTQSDRRLVTLVRGGYEAAFEEIVRRYGAPLGRYARAIVGGHAEDVTQDAFSKALLALRRDGAEIELRPWLYRIVRNTALNDLRDRPPAAQELTEPLARTGSVSEEVERREEVAELTRRLRELPEPQRAAIVMRELEGLSHEEIAAALGVTGGAARQTIHRARAALRDAVGAAIPLPLLRILIDHGAEASAAGAGAGGAAAAAASVGSAGAGGVLKAGLATALIAGSVGTGLVVHRDRHELHASAARAATVPRAQASEENGGGSPAQRGGSDSGGAEERSGGGSGQDGPGDRGHGGSEPGDDSSQSGNSGPGASGPSDHSGPGRSGSGEDDGGPSSNSGPGSGSDRDPSGDDGRLSEHSGSGRSGSGGGSGEESLSGSGSSSGPGSGETTLPDGDSSGPGSGDLLPVPGDGDSSGPGDGSSGSGTSGSDDSL
jgi:RNA polymerase sigma factor (sigma-70 family)